MQLQSAGSLVHILTEQARAQGDRVIPAAPHKINGTLSLLSQSFEGPFRRDGGLLFLREFVDDLKEASTCKVCRGTRKAFPIMGRAGVSTDVVGTWHWRRSHWSKRCWP